jgi:hypothetical protein
MAITLRKGAWKPQLSKLSEWYDAGFRALWRHLRTTLALESRAQRTLESAAAYCRTHYVRELTREQGPEEAQRVLERERPL